MTRKSFKHWTTGTQDHPYLGQWMGDSHLVKIYSEFCFLLSKWSHPSILIYCPSSALKTGVPEFARGFSRLLIAAALTFPSTVRAFMFTTALWGDGWQLHFRHKRNPHQNLTAKFMCPSEDAWLFWVKQHQAVIPFKVWRSTSGWL